MRPRRARRDSANMPPPTFSRCLVLFLASHTHIAMFQYDRCAKIVRQQAAGSKLMMTRIPRLRSISRLSIQAGIMASSYSTTTIAGLLLYALHHALTRIHCPGLSASSFHAFSPVGSLFSLAVEAISIGIVNRQPRRYKASSVLGPPTKSFSHKPFPLLV